MTDRSINNLRVAAVQMNSTAERSRNLATAERLVRAGAEQGAELVVLPEKWPALGESSPGEDSGALEWAGSLARELGIDLIAGSGLVSEGGASAGSPAAEADPAVRPANVSIHFGPDGTERARYAKLHMFDAVIEGESYRESDGERAGDAIVVSELAGGVRVGLSVCYDIRFPELYRALVDRGAELLIVPSAFTLPTTRDHWEVLVRARAIENLAFVVAPNQVGVHGDGKRSGGRSLIVDPWGVILAGASDGESVLLAELDLGVLARARENLPALTNRRRDVFAGVPETAMGRA